MKNKIGLILVCFFIISMHSSAQQALGKNSEIVSPEINTDNTVTFRLQAPNANEVKIAGDWIPSDSWSPGTIVMTKDADGVWSYTSPILVSDLHSYSFIVDGVKVNDPNNVYENRDVSTVSNIFIIGGDQGNLYKVNNVPHGSVVRRWYDSPGNNMQRRITVYTPPGYEEGTGTYPVLYLLHGMGGDEEAWMALGRTSQILDNLIAQGKAKPMIVVMTNGNVALEAAPGESSLGFYKPSFELPHTMDGKMEETFVDVMKFVEKNYRVQNNKQGRAIAGLSMGGFHALHISRYYPNTFDYVGLFSAAVNPRGDIGNTKVYADIDATLAKQRDNGVALYWIAIGKTDFLYQEMTDYRKQLDTLGMKYVYHESEGGHTWSNWRNYLSEFAPKLFK